ncbi:MAG TPA: PLDc N-terminal domain-containing protein [Candidatus Rifleibacterium sp.]|nr:PLDc N-terminal domain-containing protein [Candidatus Rifleibacterium sp.]HPT46605.1 PLDc N-terminal domain-containing protein [Candidatus Rifleibacterium sp.]
MGIFSTLSSMYVLFAFAFQSLALGFVGYDSRGRSNRALWLLATLLTGPIGLLIYFFKGRAS